MPGPFDDWLLCAITSQLRHEVKFWDEMIRETDGDFKTSGLRAPSLIRLGKMATVEGPLLEETLGRISNQRLGEVLARLCARLKGQAEAPPAP